MMEVNKKIDLREEVEAYFADANRVPESVRVIDLLKNGLRIRNYYEPNDLPLPDDLTEREMDMVILWCFRRSTREIASVMGCSHTHVRHVVQRVKRKFLGE